MCDDDLYCAVCKGGGYDVTTQHFNDENGREWFKYDCMNLPVNELAIPVLFSYIFDVTRQDKEFIHLALSALTDEIGGGGLMWRLLKSKMGGSGIQKDATVYKAFVVVANRATPSTP